MGIKTLQRVQGMNINKKNHDPAVLLAHFTNFFFEISLKAKKY